MNGINSFIISFCAGCVLLGFLYMLCPAGSMSAIVKYVFCLCFMCCVLGTVFNISQVDFSFAEGKTDEILNPQTAAATAQMVFSEALSSQQINFTKILVDVNKSDDNSIVISRVTVYTNEDGSKIKQAIGSDSYEVQIINE